MVVSISPSSIDELILMMHMRHKVMFTQRETRNFGASESENN
ncbi:MAG: hypothetical protein ACLTXL_07330 [Clostridia bacterium]